MTYIRLIAEGVGYIAIMYGVCFLIWLNWDSKVEIKSSMYFDDEVQG